VGVLEGGKMFTAIEHFENTWTQEMRFTQSVMDALTDNSLSQSVADDHRTLGQMAWHIVVTIPELANMIKIEISGPDHKAPLPATAAEIKEAYRKVSESLLGYIRATWNDDTLHQEDDLWGERWKRGRTMQVLLNHEIHHRGQMTVLMRQAGLKVPSIYGPAKEEWEAQSTTPPEI